MKNRIIALVLTVVMSLLVLTSCGSFNPTEDTIDATFNYEQFKKAYSEITIKDGTFTTDEATRLGIVNDNIYNAVAKAIVGLTDEKGHVTTGTIGKGDVLYFVYHAVEKDADGNVINTFFTSDMKESTLNTSSHVAYLGDIKETDKFLTALKGKLDALGEYKLEDYIYSMLTKEEITEKATEEYNKVKDHAEGDTLDKAIANALNVKEGDTIVISYTRKEGTKTEVANYETIKVGAGVHALDGKFIEEKAIAKIGGTLSFTTDEKDDKGNNKTTTTFTIGEATYENVKILWKVETPDVQPLITFDFKQESSKSVKPDGLYDKNGSNIELKDKTLEYRIYPVYLIDAPAAEEMTGFHILAYLQGKKLTKDSFKVLADEEKYSITEGETKKTVKDLLKEVADVYDTKNANIYKDGSDIKALLNAYDDAVKKGGSQPTSAQQAVINEALKELSIAQQALLNPIVEKIAKATNGTDAKTLGEVVLEEHNKNIYHTEKEKYDKEIIEKVQTKVWELILSSVTINSYPEKLVEEYKDHIYESYEYDYYNDKNITGVKNSNKFKAHLRTTLKVNTDAEVDKKITEQAKEYLKPILSIFVVAKACEADAKAKLSGDNSYYDLDVKAGLYHTDEEKNAVLKNKGSFIIDDAYLKAYKKEIGNASYRNIIENLGEINLRTTFQFDKLFYYLTAVEYSTPEGEDHAEVVYKTVDNVKYLSFRTVSYKIEAETTEEK